MAPFYEYVCDPCEVKKEQAPENKTFFEKMLSVSQRDIPQTCPACNGCMTTRRLISAGTQFALKSDGRKDFDTPF